MRTALALAALAATLTLMPAPAGAIIQPSDLAFVPIQMAQYFGVLGPVAVVASGGVVTWENHEFLQPVVDTHTVVADDGSFDSGDILLHLSFSTVIDKPSGSIVTYHCFYHPWMVGVIVVT
jgi:plastocyanin